MESNEYGFQEVEPEFLDVMGATVRVYRHNPGSNRYGANTFQAVPVVVPCYITNEQTTYRDNNGEDTVSSGKAYLGWVVPWLSTKDKFEVPDLSTATGWRRTFVGVVRMEYGPNGPHHQELFFGQHSGTQGGNID